MSNTLTRIAILDLCLPARDEFVKFFSTKHEEDISVITVSVNTVLTSHVDYLILLDTGGYDCTSPAFFPMFPIPPIEVPGQHQWMNYFDLCMLEKWLGKGTTFVGYGTGAAYVWDKVLGRKKDPNREQPQHEKTKLTVGDDGLLVPIVNENVAEFDDTGCFIGKFEGHMGYVNIPFRSFCQRFFTYVTRSDRSRPAGDDSGDIPEIPVPVNSSGGFKANLR